MCYNWSGQPWKCLQVLKVEESCQAIPSKHRRPFWVVGRSEVEFKHLLCSGSRVNNAHNFGHNLGTGLNVIEVVGVNPYLMHQLQLPLLRLKRNIPPSVQILPFLVGQSCPHLPGQKFSLSLQTSSTAQIKAHLLVNFHLNTIRPDEGWHIQNLSSSQRKLWRFRSYGPTYWRQGWLVLIANALLVCSAFVSTADQVSYSPAARSAAAALLPCK